MTCPIYEITLLNGFGYACLLRRHPTYGDMLGVDPTLRGAPLFDPDDFMHGLTVIFPLAAAMSSGAVPARPIGECANQDHQEINFKFAVRDNDGHPIYWWLWDGNTIQIAGTDQDLSKLPERRVLTPQEFMRSWS